MNESLIFNGKNVSDKNNQQNPEYSQKCYQSIRSLEEQNATFDYINTLEI